MSVVPGGEPDRDTAPILQAAEATLRDARTRDEHWMGLGKALMSLESLGFQAPNNRTWINHASDISGIEQNQLARMRRVVAFIDEQRQAGLQAFADRLAEMRFSHSETLMRMHAVSPEEAIAYASGARGKLRYMQLLGAYNALRDGAMDGASMSSAKRATALHQDRCAAALRSGPWAGMGTGDSLLRIARASSLVQPDFILVRPRPNGFGRHVDAVDCNPTVTWRTKWMGVMAKLAAEATFFDRHWLVLDDGRNLDDMIAMRGKLNIPNLGFVLLSPGPVPDTLVVARVVEPWSGPFPDRRDLWLSELSKPAARQILETARTKGESSDDDSPGHRLAALRGTP